MRVSIDQCVVTKVSKSPKGTSTLSIEEGNSTVQLKGSDSVDFSAIPVLEKIKIEAEVIGRVFNGYQLALYVENFKFAKIG